MMADDYLWNRSGTPDPEIVHLEKLLTEYRYSPQKAPRSSVWKLVAVAASFIVVASLALWLRPRPLSDWRVGGNRVAVGQTIETDANSYTKLEAQFIGEVKLDPGSQVQVLPSATGTQRLALRRGTMHAFIWAPPAKFLVETPSARTIDLGCAYTLTVLPDDSGILKVRTGWVAFQSGALESFIPSGAMCRTRPRLGPGLPYFENTSKALQEGVQKFDLTGGGEGLREIVSSAGEADALTLWHLISRTSGTNRSLVVERLASVIPGLDTTGLNAGNTTATDQAWNKLGLGETDWWRLWKQGWQRY